MVEDLQGGRPNRMQRPMTCGDLTSSYSNKGGLWNLNL